LSKLARNSMKRGRRWLPELSVAALLVAMFTMVALTAGSQVATANQHLAGGPTKTHNVQPIFVAGNPACVDVNGGTHSFKIDTVGAGSHTDPVTGTTFILTVNSVFATPNEGPSFDFAVTDGVVYDVIVKGGPNANHYDYNPAGVTGDTWLHAPLGAGPGGRRFFGLSHIEFCYTPVVEDVEIEISKVAVEGTITVGDRAAFDITVTSVGTDTAVDVTITDTLPNTILDWEIVSENGVPGADKCTIGGTNNNELSCDVGDLDAGDAFTVRVQTTTTIQLSSALCNTTLENTAVADAENADQVQDDATIRVECGAIQIVKVDENGDALAGSGFTLFEGHDAETDGSEVAVNPPGQVTTGADGIACFDGLPTYSDFTARETTTPAGYAFADDTNVSTQGEADCESSAGAPVSVTVTNVPKDQPVTVTKLKEGTNTGLAGFTFAIFAGFGDTPGAEGTEVDSDTTDAQGNVTFNVTPGDYRVCEMERADPSEYWTAADPQCKNVTVAVGGTPAAEVTFENAPLARVQVLFFDETGFTNATIACVDADDNPVGGEPGNTIADLLVELDHLPIGTYTCTIVIVNGKENE
jgi:hypothetical protein